MGPEYLMRFLVAPKGQEEGISARVEKRFYPFAEGGPVTYTERGHALPGFGNDQEAPGGWRIVSDWVMAGLEARGLPRTEPSPDMTLWLQVTVLALALWSLLLYMHSGPRTPCPPDATGLKMTRPPEPNERGGRLRQ